MHIYFVHVLIRVEEQAYKVKDLSIVHLTLI